MAEGGQPRPALDGLKEYAFGNVELFKTETLGTGSYGAVCKAKCDELICAAKLLYPVLFQMQPQAPEPGKEHRQPFRRFELECRFLSRINHPNIVQYLGTYRDPETNAPVLLMELMDESLTHFLESSPGPILYHVQVNLSYDVAQALAFLHANGITHRDLSSNNVLLLAGRAKVTDFGMSKFADIATTRLATMTTCPGTPAFMSPEALNEPPVYTEKLDVFSLGVLIIQIVTKEFPKPTDRFQMMELVNPRFPNRTIQAQVAVPEVERRHAHISLVDPTHPLLPIALHCLKDKDVERPSSQQLCQTLGALKETTMYEGSSRQDKDHLLRVKDEQIQSQAQEIAENTQQILAKDTEIQQLTMRLEDVHVLDSKDEVVDSKDNEIQQLTERLEQSTQDVQVLRHEAEAKERQLRSLNQQMESNEEITAALQQAITQREREITELRQVLSTKNEETRDTSNRLQRLDISNRHPTENSATPGDNIVWGSLPNAPVVDGLISSTSAVIGNRAYFRTSSNTVHEFNSKTKRWCRLPDHPNSLYTVACVENILISVGGWYEGLMGQVKYSNRVYSHIGRNWVEQFPPMPTKRQTPATVYANNMLVVAGGFNHTKLKIVEILNTQNKQWSSVSSLPFVASQTVMTFCDDHIYLSLRYRFAPEEKYSNFVLKCSLTLLVQSKPKSTVWVRIADPPVHSSFLTTINGHLLAICGQRNISVHKYNPSTTLWEVIGQMPVIHRSQYCSAAVLPGNKLLVIGEFDGTNIAVIGSFHTI